MADATIIDSAGAARSGEAGSREEDSFWIEVRPSLILLGCLSIVLLYSFWNSLSALGHYWHDPRYSHGYLVPVFAAILLWMRWDRSSIQRYADIPTSMRWLGFSLLAGGFGLRLLAAYKGMEVPDMVSFLPCLAGICLICGGWRFFVWTGPIVAFLIFMFPLPWRVSNAVLVPLQKVAAMSSTFLLQLMGYSANRFNNIIEVNGHPLEVVSACSGLRMLTIFLALCGAVALVINRPLWERILIFASAVPIALAVNIIRITATGMAHVHIGGEFADKIFHDGAGFVMMPVAMLILYLEMLFLSNLFVEAGDSHMDHVSPLGHGNAVAATSRPRRQQRRPRSRRAEGMN